LFAQCNTVAIPSMFVLFHIFSYVSIELVPEILTSLNDDIEAEQRSMRSWGNLADGYTQTIIDMQRVSRLLQAEVTALHNLFLPIRSLHTTATWEGDAATLSRQRLDTTESRFAAALAMINSLIGDLRGEIIATERLRTNARANEDAHRREANALQTTLNAVTAIQTVTYPKQWS